MGHSCRAPNLCRANPGGASHAFFGEALAASEDDGNGCYGLRDFGVPAGDGWDASLDPEQLQRYVAQLGNLRAPSADCDGGWHLHKRTHVLSNGEIIWDLSGNVWNWVDETVETGRARAAGADRLSDGSWVDVNDAVPTAQMPAESYMSRNTDLTNGELSASGNQLAAFQGCNCIGRMHPCPEPEAPGRADSGTIMRGGDYMHGYDNSGIYAVGMGYGPATDHLECQVGFRCVYQFQE